MFSDSLPFIISWFSVLIMAAVHKYLTEDLLNERLSANANLRRQVLSEKMGTISQKIQSTHPSVRPRVNIPSNLPQAYPAQKPPLGQKPPTTAQKSSTINQKAPALGPKPMPGQKPPFAQKPPVAEQPSMLADEEQEMYEIPVVDNISTEPEAETYLDFEPSVSHDNEEPQVCLLSESINVPISSPWVLCITHACMCMQVLHERL